MKFNISRSIQVKAAASQVKPLIAHFEKWNLWSPWTIAEPDCKVTVEGEAGKVGHRMSWEGEVIGSGHQTVVSVEENKIGYDLMFLTPFKSRAKTSLSWKEVSGVTTVTWTMQSSLPFFLFFMVGTMKAWIEMDFDRGLRMLKEVAEKGVVQAKTTHEGIKDFQGFSYVGLQRTAKISEMKQMSKDFEKIIEDVVKNLGKGAKHWVALYPKYNMKKGEMTYIAAISDEELQDVSLGADYVRGTIDSGRVFEVKHRGSYDFIGNAWSMGMMYLRAKKHKQKGVPFEYYWNSPLETPEEELETSIYFPLK